MIYALLSKLIYNNIFYLLLAVVFQSLLRAICFSPSGDIPSTEFESPGIRR